MASSIFFRATFAAVGVYGAFSLLSDDQHRKKILRGQDPVQPSAGLPKKNAAFAALGAPTDPSERTGILATVGNTPLVELKSLKEGTGCRILLKMEDRNPGASVKDRAALYMIEDLERRGLLKPGVTTITEGTGGNTGIGLALVAKAKGLKLKLAMPSTIAEEKIKLMQALGAETLLCPPVPFTNMNHYFHIARALGEQEDHFFTNQFENLWNGAAHYYSTAPEIWEQTDGQIDGFICAAGTGGTINGVSNFLKEQNPEIKTYLIDPLGSGLFNAVTDGTYKVVELADGSTIKSVTRSAGGSIAEGIGVTRITNNFDNARIDGAFQCTNRETVEMAFYLQHHEGIFIGPSAALNVVGAVKLARSLGYVLDPVVTRFARLLLINCVCICLRPDHVVVTIACDNGTRYMSKKYSLAWLKEQGLEPNHTDDTSLSWVL